MCIGPIALALHGLKLEALLDDVNLGEVAAPELLFTDHLGYELVTHLLDPLIFCDECLDCTNDRSEVELAPSERGTEEGLSVHAEAQDLGLELFFVLVAYPGADPMRSVKLS